MVLNEIKAWLPAAPLHQVVHWQQLPAQQLPDVRLFLAWGNGQFRASSTGLFS